MDHVTIDGMRIAYRERGKGRPLVLLHGAISDGRDWRPQIEDLSDEFRVVAWDAPGAGSSSDPPESFSISDYAAALAGFMRELGLERPHVCGLSFGAGLAIALYEHDPSLPASLVLASAYAGWRGSLPAEEVQQRLQGALRDTERPADELVSSFLPSLFASAVSQRTIDEIRSIMLEFHPAGVRAMARSFAEADLRHVLPSIAVPTLLLYGDRDVRAPRAVAEQLHGAIARSRLVFIDGVGHQSNLEAPRRFNEEVRAFLGSVD